MTLIFIKSVGKIFCEEYENEIWETEEAQENKAIAVVSCGRGLLEISKGIYE